MSLTHIPRGLRDKSLATDYVGSQNIVECVFSVLKTFLFVCVYFTMYPSIMNFNVTLLQLHFSVTLKLA